MAKKYQYNRIYAFLKGLVTLSSLAYFISLIAFISFIAINYLPFLNGIIDFTELKFVVSKIFLKLDAFLIIGTIISLLGFIWSVTIFKAVSAYKGGFRSALLVVISGLLIAFYFIIISKGLSLSYILNYAFGGILVVGLFGLMLGLFALFIRSRTRRQMEKKLRKYEKNYLNFEKHNR